METSMLVKYAFSLFEHSQIKFCVIIVIMLLFCYSPCNLRSVSHNEHNYIIFIILESKQKKKECYFFYHDVHFIFQNIIFEIKIFFMYLYIQGVEKRRRIRGRSTVKPTFFFASFKNNWSQKRLNRKKSIKNNQKIINLLFKTE